MNADGRFDHDGDWIAGQTFTADDLRLTPEEYAARHGHRWGCFSYHLYRYRDQALGAWVRRLGEILSDDDELERCRQRFLTPQELAAVRADSAGGF